jgi:type II secretory pathway pseudopilin PulG
MSRYLENDEIRMTNDESNSNVRMTNAQNVRRRGFTAFEALLAAAILAFLTAAVSGALMAGRAQSKLARDTLYASMLAHGLMDEVTRLPVTDPLGYTNLGPDPNETRSTFNCAKDYHNYTDGPTTIADMAGNAYPSTYQVFVRKVTVSTVSYTPTGWGRTVSGLLVTVTVTRDGQELIALKRLKCN